MILFWRTLREITRRVLTDPDIHTVLAIDSVATVLLFVVVVVTVSLICS